MSNNKKEKFQGLLKEKSQRKKVINHAAQEALLGNVHNTTKNDFVNKSENESVNIEEIADLIVQTQKLTQEKKEKFEDKHVKQTYWIRKDLHLALNKISIRKGEKTKIINQALENFFINKAREL